MTDLLIAAAAAPSITIELPTAMTAVLGLIGLLFALIAWCLKETVADNKSVHKELGERIGKVESELAKVRESVGRIEGYLYRPYVAAGSIYRELVPRWRTTPQRLVFLAAGVDSPHVPPD